MSSTINVPVPARRMEKILFKENFADRVGKSFSTIKSNMSKALHAHATSNDKEAQVTDSSLLPSNQKFHTKSRNFPALNHFRTSLPNDIDALKQLLHRKELFITELEKKYCEDCLRFEEEKHELNQRIEQLQGENIKLKQQLRMQ